MNIMKEMKTVVQSSALFIQTNHWIRQIERLLFFKDGGRPYLRRVYRNNRLELEQGLKGSVVDLSYEEKYIYEGDEVTPSSVLKKTFDKSTTTNIKEVLKSNSKNNSNTDFMQDKDLNWR